MTVPKRKKNLVNRKCSDLTFIIILDNRRLKLEILVASIALSGSLFQKFITRLWNILASRILSFIGLCLYLFGIGSDHRLSMYMYVQAISACHVLQCMAAFTFTFTFGVDYVQC